MQKPIQALILFGHGARDARWREPFDQLVHLWRAQHPTILIQAAFLELMEPNLEVAIGRLVGSGAKSVVVVPVFFGQGGHLRQDFPELLSQCQAQYPQISLSATSPVGESEAVLQAIIDFSALSLQ